MTDWPNPLEVRIVERTDIPDDVSESQRIGVRAHGMVCDRCSWQCRQPLVDGEHLCLGEVRANASGAKWVGDRERGFETVLRRPNQRRQGGELGGALPCFGAGIRRYD